MAGKRRSKKVAAGSTDPVVSTETAAPEAEQSASAPADATEELVAAPEVVEPVVVKERAKVTKKPDYPVKVIVRSRCYVPVQIPSVGLDLPAYTERTILIRSQVDLDRMKDDLASVANAHGFDSAAYEVKD